MSLDLTELGDSRCPHAKSNWGGGTILDTASSTGRNVPIREALLSIGFVCL